MNETDAVQVLVGDCLEATFPRHYSAKEFMHDASRLRDLARLQTRQALNEAEVAEAIELRRRLKRADADAVMLAVIAARLHAAFNSSDHPWLPRTPKLRPSMPPCPSNAVARRGRRPGIPFPTRATPWSASAGLGTPASFRHNRLPPPWRVTRVSVRCVPGRRFSE